SAAVQPAGPEPMMITFSTEAMTRPFPKHAGLAYTHLAPIVGGRTTGTTPAPVRREAMLRLTDLREILRYVPRFRERIFVIALDGAIVEGENFRNLLLDIALLRSLRIGVALVHGAGHQVRKLADATGQSASNLDGTGVTDAATLQIAL